MLRTDGHREVLGVDVGDSENETFWTEFLRDLKARHNQRQVIGALIRTVFAQPDRDRAVTQLRQVVDQLQAMEDDLLAYASFPPGHWSKIWSNNPNG